MSTMVMAPPAHPRVYQRVSSPSKKTHTTERAESAAATNKKLHAIMMATKAREGEEDDGDAPDDDRGEGTSAAGAAAAASSLAQTTTGAFAKHLDIAALLKEPLQFVPARLPDSSQRDVPYEPLPGPPVPGAIANGQVNGKNNLPVRSNGKQVANGDEEENGETSTASPAIKVKTSSAEIPIPTSWPQAFPLGPGYGNLGNTCFLNSTLQALSHTAPLVGCLLSDSYHSSKTCRLAVNRKFCLLCAMQTHIRICFNRNSSRPSSIEPRQIVGNLKQIAKQMRVGRQEDAHEFLRFSLDHMQTSAAANMQPPAKTEAQKDATWMNRIFGGRLRSRVSCMSCKQDSDTYDNFMDLSLDVAKLGSVKEALKAFVKIDQLSGSNKYKCEKCKKLVNARKQFTINQAPQILHIHLKRFTPTGKKISGSIQYPEQLRLREYMSDPESEDPQFRLYAIVSHSGSGPHSGHYYAHVRAGNQQWYSMNDSSVSSSSIQQALNQRNAYLLFYERIKRLDDVLNFSAPKANGHTEQKQTSGAMAGVKRKERDEDDEDDSKSQGSPFPAQQIKRHQANGVVGNGFRPPYALPSQQQHSSPSRPSNYFQQKKESEKRRHSLPGMKPGNFYSPNKHANRPRLVSGMKGRP